MCTLSMLLLSLLSPGFTMGQGSLKMPGKSFRGQLPELTEQQRALSTELRTHVDELAAKIGERNVSDHAGLMQAAAYIERSLTKSGYKLKRQTYMVRGRPCHNIAVELRGSSRPEEIVVVGAHYDSVNGSPAANDNGSGVAALLTLARTLATSNPQRTLRFVAFTNEEQPYFQSDLMGSYVYARACKSRKEKIVGMLSLETMGYYSDAKNSQRYPAPLAAMYPSTGNFIAFVGNSSSGSLVKQAVASFRQHAKFPSEGASLPSQLEGVGWSDHWSFWQFGYPALMVTDTAFFRYPYYHSARDTPDKLKYGRTARVVAGLEHVIKELASPDAAKAQGNK